MAKLKVLLVDDHQVVRLGLVYILRDRAGFEVVGEVATAEEAIDLCAHEPPDVVLMDVRLPGKSGVEACREIRSLNPDIRVIMLTSFSDEEALFNSILAGASGYLLKHIQAEELINAVQRVGRGESLLDPQVTGAVMQKLKNIWTDEDEELALLSDQEKKILALIAQGKTNNDIAQALVLSPRTIKNYVSNVLSKLHLNNRAEAAAFAVRRNLKA